MSQLPAWSVASLLGLLERQIKDWDSEPQVSVHEKLETNHTPRNDQRGFQGNHTVKEMVMPSPQPGLQTTKCQRCRRYTCYLEVHSHCWVTGPEGLAALGLRTPFVWLCPSGTAWTSSILWTINRAVQTSQRRCLPLLNLGFFFLCTQKQGKLTNFIKTIWGKQQKLQKYELWRQKRFCPAFTVGCVDDHG